MQDIDGKDFVDVLDAAQLVRIESVHRGFLYQHLYAVGCLLNAQTANIEMAFIERDEDIEIVSGQERIYVQVKTRSKSIIPSDIKDALTRFDGLRKEHSEGTRKGKASFVIVANYPPSVELQRTIDDNDLPGDTELLWPHSKSTTQFAIPPAWTSLADAISWCVERAARLNFSLLSPDSLVWKLAGLVQLAATGSPLNKQHVFRTAELPRLFEQLVIQLQDFPAPPPSYRPQKQEPSLTSIERVRIVCGLSGAGKTAWAAQAALHCPIQCAYYDTGDLPGPALAVTLVRELAAKFATSDRDGLRKIILPGGSGYDALRALDTHLAEKSQSLLVVLDNAHRIPVENLRDTLNATKEICFILLCQPHENIRQLEAFTGLQREQLLGWDIDTVATAVSDIGGFSTIQGYEQLRTHTGGLPLYVESAAKIALSEYAGNVDVLISDLTSQENSVETVQETILSRVFSGFDTRVKDALALFSLADVGLTRDEVSAVLMASFDLSSSGAATLLKKMRATGTIEAFGNQTLKVHDAVRTLGLQHLELMSSATVETSLLTLKDLLIEGLVQRRDTSRFALLTKLYIKLNDAMTLIAISGEEMFYEMGLTIDIEAALESAIASSTMEPIHKFWALDGLVFAENRDGILNKNMERLDAMAALIAEHKFGHREEITYALKRILYSAENEDAAAVQRIVDETTPKMPDAEHQRIFEYNHAFALWKLKRFKDAENLCKKVLDQYFAVIGTSSRDVIGKNPDVLWQVINRTDNVQDDLKHLADSLELYAVIRQAQNKETPYARIHAMKFYNMAGAPDSMVRVGQDLADEFVAKRQYVAAKEVIEQFVLPVIDATGLISKLIQVRSQYAVILGLCGNHKAALLEMQRLDPYLEGLSATQRQEIENQRALIALLAARTLTSPTPGVTQTVGRNEQCPCGSGVKFKKCHGKV